MLAIKRGTRQHMQFTNEAMSGGRAASLRSERETRATDGLAGMNSSGMSHIPIMHKQFL